MLRLRASVIDTIGRLDSRIRDWLGEMLLTPASRARSQPIKPAMVEQEFDLSFLDYEERRMLEARINKRLGLQIEDVEALPEGETLQ
jgi:hypothetical protein